MNRKDWEAQIFASDLNPTARMVAIVVGSFGNWSEDREVWPSVKAIADMAGMSRETAGLYMTALREQGWLTHVRTLKNNVKVYDLAAPEVVGASGILAKPTRGNQYTRLSVVPTTKDDSEELGCRNKQIRLSEQAGLVVGSPSTNIKEPTIKEPTTNMHQENKNVSGSSTPGPVGPVDTNVISLPLSTNTSRSSLSHEERERFFKNSRYAAKPVCERAKQLILTRDFEPDQANEAVRVNYAFEQASREIHTEQEQAK